MTKLSTNSDLSMDSIYKKEDKQVKLVTLRGNKLLVSEPGYLGHPTKQIPTPQNNFQPKKMPYAPHPHFSNNKSFHASWSFSKKIFFHHCSPHASSKKSFSKQK